MEKEGRCRGEIIVGDVEEEKKLGYGKGRKMWREDYGRRGQCIVLQDKILYNER